MAKVVLSDLTSIQNDPSAVDTINNNSEIIEDAFDNTLSRDGSTPNQMESNLDMNNNRILNLPRPFNPNEPARLRDVGDARSLAEDAAASAAAAAISASEAEQSSINAATHEAGAGASATAAHASEVAAAASASSASTSAATATTQAGIATTQATNAGNSATAAAGSASSASTSATNAANSASSASSSASAASTSATNASNSATAASGSASSAATSATNAGSSATAASGSASAAASSATAAHTSEVNAGTSATNAASSASTASTQASNAASSASAASTSASNAASSASSASTSASNASASASSASTSASNALTSENNAEQALEDFQDIYLGAYASDPSTTPSGAAISTGMMYWNTAVPELRIYNGSSWSAYSPSGGSVSSVFGRTGAVVASSGDYNFNQLSGNISTGQMASGSGASSSTYWRGDGTWSSPAGGVTSWNTRTGAVVPATNDYSFSQLSGNIATGQMNSGTSASANTYWRGDGTWVSPNAYITVATATATTSVASIDLTIPNPSLWKELFFSLENCQSTTANFAPRLNFSENNFSTFLNCANNVIAYNTTAANVCIERSSAYITHLSSSSIPANNKYNIWGTLILNGQYTSPYIGYGAYSSGAGYSSVIVGKVQNITTGINAVRVNLNAGNINGAASPCTFTILGRI